MRSPGTHRRAAANRMRASALIGTRLRSLREQKGFSQGDIEQRSGLLRCYISSVEHSHTVPSIDTLEKMAGALDVPLYRLFYEVEESGDFPEFRRRRNGNGSSGGSSREDPHFLRQLRKQVYRMDERQRGLLLFMARKMTRAGADRQERRV